MKKALILALALFLNIGLCFAEPCAGENRRCTEYYSGTKTVKAKYKLKDGKIEGKYKEFFLNKKLKVLANYKAGLLEGEHLTYYDNSQIMLKEFYKDNRKHGMSYLYNLEGKLLNSTTYYYGKKQGYSFDYLTDTKIEKYYDNDELAIQKEYTYDDVLLEEKFIELARILKNCGADGSLEDIVNEFKTFKLYYGIHLKENGKVINK